MNLLPVVANRSSDALRSQRLVYQSMTDQTRLQRLFDQLSTGNRVLRGSDDPTAAARALGLRHEIAGLDRVVTAASSTERFLNVAEATLGDIDATLISARSISLEAAQTTLSSDARTALAEEVSLLLTKVVSLGNQQFADTNLFGGVLTQGSTLEQRGNDFVFRGNASQAKPNLLRSSSFATLPTGEEALGLGQPIVKGVPLREILQPSTRLVDIRQGEGVQPGIIRLSDGTGWTEVDLRGAVTLGDLAEKIGNVELNGRPLALDIQQDSVTLRYADNLNGTLATDDAPGGRTLQQLNLRNPLGLLPPPLSGSNLEPKISPLTRLADLNDGNGIDVSAGFRITQAASTFDIDLSSAETIDDVLSAINRSGADVRAEVDSTSGAIQMRFLRSGVDYSIGELGGNVATDLGLRTNSTSTRLDQLQRGRGVLLNGTGTSNLSIRRPDGSILEIDGAGLETVSDVIMAINNHPDNQDAVQVTASLSTIGNGLQITGVPDAFSIEVTQAGRSNLGTALGWIPAGATAAESTVVDGVAILRGNDFMPVEPADAVDTLVRLQSAVESGDLIEIERMTNRLDTDLDRAIRTRGRLGFRSQTVTALKTIAEDYRMEKKSRVSESIEADLTEVISQISSRQSAIQASLQLVAKASGLSVLNFL